MKVIRIQLGTVRVSTDVVDHFVDALEEAGLLETTTNLEQSVKQVWRADNFPPRPFIVDNKGVIYRVSPHNRQFRNLISYYSKPQKTTEVQLIWDLEVGAKVSFVPVKRKGSLYATHIRLLK